MTSPSSTTLHGGNLHAIASQYSIPLSEWLDLSTGIAPISYPVPSIPERVWQRLPEKNANLQNVACEYYQCKNLLATSGSQAAIQLLPKVLSNQLYKRAWLPKVGYREHKNAFNQTAVTCLNYQTLPSANQLNHGDIVLVINPNNPTGQTYTQQALHTLLEQLTKLNGLLIVDEAFIDCTPQCSMMKYSHRANLVVLRSIGKFFGLAGIRLGFVGANPKLLNTLEQQLGPWAVNHPAQFIAEQALADTSWHQEQRNRLAQLCLQLKQILSQAFTRKPVGTDLFQTVLIPDAPAVHQKLCEQGIYVRLLDEQNGLRFGIPPSYQQSRLSQALGLIR